MSDVALADDSASRIVKRYAAAVGLDPAVYSGHSLRTGFCRRSGLPLCPVGHKVPISGKWPKIAHHAHTYLRLELVMCSVM